MSNLEFSALIVSGLVLFVVILLGRRGGQV
jgi:hypothetical protein